MKLKLKKQVVKTLSRDDKKLPLDMTPQVAGGWYTDEHTDTCDCTGTNPVVTVYRFCAPQTR